MIAEREYKMALDYNVNATKSFGYWVIKKYENIRLSVMH